MSMARCRQKRFRSEPRRWSRHPPAGLQSRISSACCRWIDKSLAHRSISHSRNVRLQSNASLIGIDLMILDNISTLVSSGRENDAESWNEMQAWLLRLRRQGKTVLLIHHAGRK